MKLFYLSLILLLSIAQVTFTQNVLNTDNKLYIANHPGNPDHVIQNIENYGNDGISALKEINSLRHKVKDNSLVARSSLKYLLDSVYRNSTNDYGITWDKFYKSIYSYYPNSNVEENISYRYSNGIWINNYKTNYTLNAQNLNAGYLSQLWVAPGLWENNIKWERTYNSNGQILDDTYSDWNTTSIEWVYRIRYTSSYNAKNQLIEVVSDRYDPNSKKWDNSIRFNYSYDSNGNLTETILQNYANGMWTNGWKNISTYNSKGLLIEEFYSNWDPNGNKYVPSEKSNYTYNQFDLIEEEIYSSWIDSSMIFAIDYKSKYTYDQNNNLKESYDYEINPDSTNLLPTEQKIYYYTLHDVTTKTANIVSNNIEVYPNPFYNTIHLNNFSSDSKVKIFDITGKIIFYAVNEKILDLSALNSGVYVLEIVDNRTSSLHKIIKN